MDTPRTREPKLKIVDIPETMFEDNIKMVIRRQNVMAI